MRTLPPLHPTDADFAAIRAEGSFYVDKTGVLRALLATTSTYRLATRHQFLARPRRFGKTLLINTLEAWFQGLPPGHRANPEGDTEPLEGLPAGWTSPPWLWEGLDAKDWHGTHGWHPVIRLNLSRAAASSGSLPGGPGGYGTAPGVPRHPGRVARSLQRLPLLGFAFGPARPQPLHVPRSFRVSNMRYASLVSGTRNRITLALNSMKSIHLFKMSTWSLAS